MIENAVFQVDMDGVCDPSGVGAVEHALQQVSLKRDCDSGDRGLEIQVENGAGEQDSSRDRSKGSESPRKRKKNVSFYVPTLNKRARTMSLKADVFALSSDSDGLDLSNSLVDIDSDMVGLFCGSEGSECGPFLKRLPKVVSFSVDESVLSGAVARAQQLDHEATGGALDPKPQHHVVGGVNARSGELGLTPLMIAARENDLAEARSLLSQGADPMRKDSRGFDVLMYAVRDGHAEMSDLILRAVKRAAAKQGQRGYTFRNKDRFTHMLYAALNGHTACIEVLVRFGSRIDMCDSQGTSPLMAAAQNGHMAASQALLRLGARVDRQDRRGATALALAVRSGDLDVTNLLLSNGASVQLCDAQGRSPLLIAVIKGFSAVGEVLLSNGAQVCDKVRKAVLAAYVARQKIHEPQLKHPIAEKEQKDITRDCSSSAETKESSHSSRSSAPKDGKQEARAAGGAAPIKCSA